MSRPAAVVLGYTGAAGKAVVKELSQDDHFGRVVLVGRREAELEIENDGRFEQKMVDFDAIGNFSDVFRGCDVGFCCIGSSVTRHGKADFAKVDRDYVINTARVAKETGCKHFILMTTIGANKNSLSYAWKIKGQAEDGVRQLGFEKYSIFRPCLLVSKRAEPRLVETMFRRVTFPLKKLFPTRMTIPIETFAKGMVNNAKYMTTGEEVFDTPGFYKLAKGKNQTSNETKDESGMPSANKEEYGKAVENPEESAKPAENTEGSGDPVENAEESAKTVENAEERAKPVENKEESDISIDKKDTSDGSVEQKDEGSSKPAEANVENK